MQYFDIIKTECENIGLEINEEKYNQFIEYKDLMKEWNEKVNLTAITDDKEIVIKHFIDSIKAFEFKRLSDSVKLKSLY